MRGCASNLPAVAWIVFCIASREVGWSDRGESFSGSFPEWERGVPRRGVPRLIKASCGTPLRWTAEGSCPYMIL